VSDEAATKLEGQPKMAVHREDDSPTLFEMRPEPAAIQSLMDRYIVPPFTTLDRRAGYWQQQARRWKNLGIKSELGRQASGGAFKDLGSIVNSDSYTEQSGGIGDTLTDGMSIFDPVICELVYEWFSPTTLSTPTEPRPGVVLDPFAGGSVRGIVAGTLGRAYFGVDLSKEQIEANKEQAREIFWQHDARHIPPTWINADSRQVAPELKDMDLCPDLIFTCPPYGDLEVYSEDPHDLSAMDEDEFDQAYCEIIRDAVSILNDNRFAAVVVGNYRDKHGHLRDLMGLTVRAFEAAGARYYNEAVILDPIGSAAVRAKRQFAAKRKMVRVHQSLLVFIKGDEAKAADAVRKENEQ
jgi:hypothetical protein